MTAQGQAFSRGKNAPCWFYGAVSVPNTTPDTLCRVFFFFLHLSGLSAECPIKHLVPGKGSAGEPCGLFESSEGQIIGVFLPFMLH